jgi:hypothetical protein
MSNRGVMGGEDGNEISSTLTERDCPKESARDTEREGIPER